MGLADQIFEHVQNLPVSKQAEVFDFVSHLERQKDETSLQTENNQWGKMSLEYALGHSEGETIMYTKEDIKEYF